MLLEFGANLLGGGLALLVAGGLLDGEEEFRGQAVDPAEAAHG